MARLPWQHTRTRTKSGNEKSLLSSSQDWFNRHTSEPSRQALNDLVKAHNRENSNETIQTRSRSRGNTVSSVDWHLDQHPGNSSHVTIASEQYQSREGSVYSGLDRSDNNTRSLLAKGGIKLRRSGSKMSLSSSSTSGSTMAFTSPSRNRSGSGSGTNLVRVEEIRNKISAPFDFRHVTHTEQGQFAALGRIDESLLASKFDAVTTQQAAGPDLRGIDAAEIRTQESGYTTLNDSNVSSAAFQPHTTASDAPTPPPKDVCSQDYLTASQISPTRTRLAQTVLEPPTYVRNDLSIDLSLACKDRSIVPQSGRSLAGADDAKPLPQLPVIHAVTTEDDSAREMMRVPLPTPPIEGSPADIRRSPTLAHQRQKSSVVLPRHFSLRPSAKASMPNLIVAESSGLSQGLPRHRSELALSQKARRPRSDDRSRMSMGFGAVDTVNWEDAIDDAWAEADDSQFGMDLPATTYQPLRKAASANLLDSLYNDFHPSESSTPLMFNAPTQPLPAIPGSTLSAGEGLTRTDSSSDLNGLGITTPTSAQFNSLHMSRSSSILRAQRRSSQYIRPDLTRSSSQESIILSIASSINGTQRSSNSSLTPDDLFNTSKIEEETAADMEMLDSIAQTRPESGCLPADIYEQMVLVGLNSPHGESIMTPMTPIPTIATHKSSLSSSKITIPDRGSSAATTEISRNNRTRSNTTGTRPRQSARISYSLFPAANTAPTVSTNVGS